jgi:hypothetical protein
MPARPRWWLRIPEILGTIESLDLGWLDRPAIEKIFQVRRRRAIELLNGFGGFQTGRTFLIERDVLVRQIRAIRDGEDYRWDQGRRRKLSEAISAARQFSQAARVSIKVLAASPALPPGVRIEPGRMTIDFDDVQDLLAKLYSISQAAARDFETFEKATRKTAPPLD